jgi:hypothetical protein
MQMVTKEIYSEFTTAIIERDELDMPNDIILRISRKHGIPTHQFIIECINDKTQHIVGCNATSTLYDQAEGNRWWVDVNGTANDQPITAEICDDSLLGQFVNAISLAIKFPVQTAFLHGLSVVASAMTRSFRYEMYGDDSNPVNLYTVSAQPPSTGKSGINGYLSRPVRQSFAELNKDNSVERQVIESQLEGMAAERKTESNETAKANIIREMAVLQERHKALPSYVYSVDDATPEAMEKIAANQLGMINVISDEADIINIVLGSVYSDKKGNNSIFLKAFDGGHHSSARSTRDGYEGPVYGCFAVLAQDESVNAILEAGQLGRGISERFLIMREPNILGTRDFTVYHAPDPELVRSYEQLVNNLVKADPTVLRFDDQSMILIQQYRNGLEKRLADGGEYSNSMLRGTLGKADKQICKISCVLHGVDNFQLSSSASSRIKPETVERAIAMYDQLKDAYVRATDSQGYAGNGAAVKVLIDNLRKFADDGTLGIDVRKLARTVEKSSLFKNTSKPTKYIRETCLPELVKLGFIAVLGDKIFINPKINIGA